MADPIPQPEAAVALLRRIRHHAQRHALPREWLTAADEVLGTFDYVKTTHVEISAGLAAVELTADSIRRIVHEEAALSREIVKMISVWRDASSDPSVRQHRKYFHLESYDIDNEMDRLEVVLNGGDQGRETIFIKLAYLATAVPFHARAVSFTGELIAQEEAAKAAQGRKQAEQEAADKQQLRELIKKYGVPTDMR